MTVAHEREFPDLAHWIGDEGEWETSPDAMHWTPDPETPEFGAAPPSAGLKALPTPNDTPDSASSRSRPDSKETPQ